MRGLVLGLLISDESSPGCAGGNCVRGTGPAWSRVTESYRFLFCDAARFFLTGYLAGGRLGSDSAKPTARLARRFKAGALQ